MHLLDVERGYYGGWGIVAGQLPLATGLALGLVRQGREQAVLCELGDGAINMGAWHESLNLAAVWRLPVVFLVMNNEYADGHERRARASAVTGLHRRAAAYDIPSERVDGNDLLAVVQAAGTLLSNARTERTPAVLELVTYRYRGHSVADPGLAYRTTEEIEEHMHKDPIEKVRGLLVADGAGAEQLAEIERTVEERVAAAVEWARADPPPPVSELAKGMYAPGSAAQFARMLAGAPFGERELVFAGGLGPVSPAAKTAPAPASGTELMTYREALRLALREELERDERVFIMGEEVGVFEGAYKVTAGLLAEFGPDRVRDTPISEEGFVGAGVGAAMIGERPVVEIMTINFLLVAMDQVVNHAAKIGAMFGGEVRCPLVIRTPNGAGNQLTAQHSQSFEGWFASTPGLKVVAPANPADAKGLLKAAIRDDDPVLVVENLAIYKERGEVPLDPEHIVPIGLANVAREGNDITLVAHGFATVRALHVAERLRRDHDVSAEVVDLRSLRPLDVDTVAESVAKTNRAVCIEEGWPSYGVTAELAARIQEGLL